MRSWHGRHTITTMEGGGGDEAVKRKLQNKVRNNDPSVRLTELFGKSQILQRFMRVERDGANTLYAACKACAVLVKYSSETGTSGLKRHTCKATPGENQAKMTSFVKHKLPVVVKIRVTNKIAWMCSQDLRPFAMVEGQGLMTVAQELLDIGSKYGGTILTEDLLPSARTVSRHVEGEYEKLKALVVEELKQCRDHALTTDLWTEEKTNTHLHHHYSPLHTPLGDCKQDPGHKGDGRGKIWGPHQDDCGRNPSGTPPEAGPVGTTEVHNFIASCVEEEEREDSGGEEEMASDRQLVLQYMLQNNPKMTRGQSLLGVWQEMSGGLVPVTKKLLPKSQQQVLPPNVLSVLLGD